MVVTTIYFIYTINYMKDKLAQASPDVIKLTSYTKERINICTLSSVVSNIKEYSKRHFFYLKL